MGKQNHQPVSNPLRAWMDRRRVSAKLIADRLDIAYSLVSNWSLGRTRPSDEMKVRLARLTLEIEAEDGWPEGARRGVPVTDWFIGLGGEGSSTDVTTAG